MSLTKNFETKPTWKLLLQYSVPSIVASSVHALYNIVDRIYIGKALGTDALAGVTLTFPIFILSIAIGVLIGNGSAAIISLRLGQKRYDDAEKTLGNTFGLFTIQGTFVAILGMIFLKQLLYLVGATEATFPYAYSYLIWFLPFMVFDNLAMGTNGAIRSEGNPKLAMKIAIYGALLNIVLDPIFLFWFDLGVKGAAMATSISRIFTTCLVLWHFTKSKHRLLTLKLKYVLPKWKIAKPMIAIGISPFTMNLATTFVAVFSNRALVAHGGDMALGALGAIQSIFVVMETPLRGLMMAGQPIIGFNFGAKLLSRVKSTLKYSYIYSLAISLTGLLAVLLFGENMVSLFSKGDPELIVMGTRGLRIFLFMIPMAGIHMMSVMYFQAIGNAKRAIVLNLLRKIILFLPALWFLPTIFGLDGVWAATPFADGISAAIAIFLVIKHMKTKLDKMSFD